MWWRKWRSAAARSSTITAAAPAGSMQTPLSTKLAECCSSAARPELAEQLQQHYKDVGSWKSRDQLPVVYHPDYNITLLGLEKLHPFDSCKFQKVAAGLQEHQVISSLKQLVQPTAVTQRTLQDVHTAEYLQELWTSSTKAAQVTELAPLAVLPASLVQRQVLKPMQTHVGGTILAAALAVVHGWAVNLGGGMHHAYWQDGSGWCPYDDITLAIRRLRKASNGAIQRVMVIDLDVHQGNGVQLDKLHFHDSDLFIVDMYNAYTFPMDTEAKAAINVKVELRPGTADAEYLAKLHQALQEAEAQFPNPHLIIYNAGTDILAGDPLGQFAVSPQGVVQRDTAIFAFAERIKCPIVMLLSGGYTRASAGVIVESLTNVLKVIATKL